MEPTVTDNIQGKLGHSELVSSRRSSIGMMAARWSSKLDFVRVTLLVGILLYIMVLVVPLFLGFYYSLTNLNPLYPDSDFIGLENYANLLDDQNFEQSLKMTAMIGVSVTLLANVLGLIIALLLNHQGPFYAFLRTIFFVPQVLSAVIVSFIWSIILNTRGFLNRVLLDTGIIEKKIIWLGLPDLAFKSLVLVIAWQMLGFCVVVYLAALQGVPKQLHEAAKIDGANFLQSFRHVTLPLIAPGVTINVVLMLIMTFKLYDQVAVLTEGGPAGTTETLSYYIIRTGFTVNQTGYASAMAVVLFLLMASISGVVVTYLRSKEVEH